jgi:hypothetical protein
MLSLFQRYGAEALAQAKYNRDFVALRQSSIYKGSLFSYKRLPQEDDAGYYGSKRCLWNYVGAVFGEVACVYGDVVRLFCMSTFVHADETSKSGGMVYVRMKCPDNPSCAVARMYSDQEETMREVLFTDQTELVRCLLFSSWSTCLTEPKDGSVKSLFFDYSAIRFDLRYNPGSFYVRVDVDSRNIAGLVPGAHVVLKVTMTRIDMPHRETGDMTRVRSHPLS